MVELPPGSIVGLGPFAQPSIWTFTPTRSKRGHARQEAILDAATAEFLQKGYQGASLRSIMAVAGGSSRTLYQQFGDKAGLFRAIVARWNSRVASIAVPQADSERPIEEDLNEVGVAYLDSFLRPEPLAFFRMMVAESATMPQIPIMVWGATHMPFTARLASFLRAKSVGRELTLEDPDLAAQQFIELTKAAIHLEILFSGRELTPEDRRNRVRRAVDIFLNGCRRDVRPSAGEM